MRLLNSSKLTLHEFFGSNIPKYAILSHRWENEEITFQDMRDEKGPGMAGWSKVAGCCAQAVLDGWEYVWIDSCCIDKSSSAELSEAINSMFRWYEKAEVCYAYLSDVSSALDDPRKSNSQFSQSKWFTRGWTLQELLAPRYVDFFDQTWTWIGSKGGLDAVICNITGIADLVNYKEASVAQKMSWASYRETTRIEDLSYCLLGLFGVHMPPLYGEGENAFMRLQLEIMKTTNDESLMAWQDLGPGYKQGLLATSPRMFANSSSVVRVVWDPSRPPHTMSSKGMCVHFKLVPGDDSNAVFLAPLNCAFRGDLSRGDGRTQVIALYLGDIGRIAPPWRRRPEELGIIDIDPGWLQIDRTMLYVPQQFAGELEFLNNLFLINFSLDSVFGTGLKYGKLSASNSGAWWGRDGGAGFERRTLHLSISVDETLPVWGSITLDKFAEHSGPRDETPTEPENYFQKFAIVVGVSNGRPWIDIVVLSKYENIELLLEANFSARPAPDGNGAMDSEGIVLARTLSSGLDRVSRKFLSGSLNGRLMTNGGGLFPKLIVEVTYDPGGKLRWPVRDPLPSELAAAYQYLPESSSFA